MRQLGMIDWRTVQLFLSDDGVHEVQLDLEDNRNQRCTCKKFQSFKNCRHVKWVEEAILEAGGHFSVEISTEIDDDEAVDAFDTPEKFRNFIIRYGRVEVI
jgi:hypothetical protein